jgi:hypothetical protein
MTKPTSARKKFLLVFSIVGVIFFIFSCLISIVLAFIFRDHIPLLSDLLPQTLPDYVYYEYPPAGVSFYYPKAWVYDDSQATGMQMISFASSKSMLDSSYSGDINNQALFAFVFSTAEAASIDPNDPESLTHFLDAQAEGMNSRSGPREFKINGYPAVAEVFTQDGINSSPWKRYEIVVLRQKRDFIEILFICTSDDWERFKPVFDHIEGSIKISAMP